MDNELHTETAKAPAAQPKLIAGYVVGVLDNGSPHFELVGAEKGGPLNNIILRGLHSLAEERVRRFTDDGDNWLRQSVRALNVGLSSLLKAEQEANGPQESIPGGSQNLAENTSA